MGGRVLWPNNVSLKSYFRMTKISISTTISVLVFLSLKFVIHSNKNCRLKLKQKIRKDVLVIEFMAYKQKNYIIWFSHSVSIPSFLRKGNIYKLRNGLLYKISPLIYAGLLKCEILGQFKQDVMLKKTSSLQGIVRPPMGWSYPNSSQLYSTSPGMKVGSRTTQGSQTASFSLQHRLQDGPFVHPLLSKMLDLLQIRPFW